MTVELLNASIDNNPENLSHVGQLLTELRSGWAAINLPQTEAAESAPEPHPQQTVIGSYGKV